MPVREVWGKRMACAAELAASVREVPGAREGVSEKKKFGGLAFMLNGNMCCGVAKTNLMLRVGPERYAAALAKPHAGPMDFTGRPLRGLVYVSQAGSATRPALPGWVAMAVDFVETLPAR